MTPGILMTAIAVTAFAGAAADATPKKTGMDARERAATRDLNQRQMTPNGAAALGTMSSPTQQRPTPPADGVMAAPPANPMAPASSQPAPATPPQ